MLILHHPSRSSQEQSILMEEIGESEWMSEWEKESWLGACFALIPTNIYGLPSYVCSFYQEWLIPEYTAKNKFWALPVGAPRNNKLQREEGKDPGYMLALLCVNMARESIVVFIVIELWTAHLYICEFEFLS